MTVFDWQNIEVSTREVLGSGDPLWRHKTTECESLCLEPSPEIGFGRVEYHQWSDGLNILWLDLKCKENNSLTTTNCGNVRLNYALTLDLSFDGLDSTTVEAKAMTWRVVNTAPSAEITETWFANERNSYLTVHCPEDLLAQLVGCEVDDLPDVLKPFRDDVPDKISVETFEYTQDMAHLVSKVGTTTTRDGLRQNLIRSQVIALLCMTTYQLSQRATSEPQISLSEQDREKIAHIAMCIEADLTAPCNFSQLCIQHGLNKNKLTHGFKELFGVTPGAFLENQRLERAYDFLTTSDKPLGHIAAEVGFSHQSTLTTAIRRKFGRKPLEIRKDAIAQRQML